jgi:peptidoglycan/xylan/chitin deacetylase (PgdA/CDA1 family)
MRFVSPLLKHAVYPVLHRTGWLDHIHPPGGYSVVNYHGVIPSDHSGGDAFLDGNLVLLETFRQQLQFLKVHYDVIHPEEFRACVEHGQSLPRRALLVTCDDGLLNTLTDMLPMLQSEDVSCLFFVTGASSRNHPAMLWYEELYNLMRAISLDGRQLQLPAGETTDSASSGNFQSQWWNAVRSASRLNAGERADWISLVRVRCDPSQNFQSERRWRLLTQPELAQLSESGMTIGAHTLTHPVLSLCSEEEAFREIKQSKVDIERAVGKPVWAFAYPFGNPATMGEREIRLAQDAGYSCAFLNVESWDSGSAHLFQLPRTHVTRNTTVAELAAHLSGLHSRLQRGFGR